MVLEGKLGTKRLRAKAAPVQPSPVSNIGTIGSLKKFSDKEYAKDMLHQIAKAVAPIIHENNFKVGTLCEMYPKNPNLLGLNVNRGQKILIRLRSPSNDRHFYPMGDLIFTFLHELTHNLYGAHDDKFYKFLDGLKKRYDEILLGGAVSGYRCEEERLGSAYNPLGMYVSVREKRIKVLSVPKYKLESRKLGSTVGSKIENDSRSIRHKLLEAAERRQRDAKWCPSHVEEDVEPNNEEMDMEVMEIFEDSKNTRDSKGSKGSTGSKGSMGSNDFQDSKDSKDSKESNSSNSFNLSNKLEDTLSINSYKEVIDLTCDEYNEPRLESEIIVIDGCEKHNKTRPKSILRSSFSDLESEKEPRRVQFSGLLPSFDEEKDSTIPESEKDDIQYTVSSSPRTFFGDEDRYPRRKMVAALNFDQILKKGELITVQERDGIDENAIISDEIQEPKKRERKTEKRQTKKADTRPHNEINPSKSVNPKPRPQTKKASLEPKTNKASKSVKTKSGSKPKPKPKPKSKPKPKQVQASPTIKKTVKSISFDQLL